MSARQLAATTCGVAAFAACASRAPSPLPVRSFAGTPPQISRVEPAPAIPPPLPTRCFGDSPPEEVAHDPKLGDLLVLGPELVWRSDDLLVRWDLASGRKTWFDFDADDLPRIAAADSRTIFAVDRHGRLIAIDMPSGERRTGIARFAWHVSPVHVPGTEASHVYEPANDARYALDADYLYFASDGALGRVRRDGQREPEILLRADGLLKDFVVADGYAYFSVLARGIERRALAPGAPVEHVVSQPLGVKVLWPLGVWAGRLFFSAVDPAEVPIMLEHSRPPPVDKLKKGSFSIESVPVGPAAADGGAPTVVHAAEPGRPFGARNDLADHLGEPGADAIIFDGLCAYSGGGQGVWRMDLRDGKIDALVGIGAPGGGGGGRGSHFFGSDDQYLYWADSTHDRIVRWKR